MNNYQSAAKRVLEVSEIFKRGCANTLIGDHPPEYCEACAKEFVEVERRALEKLG